METESSVLKSQSDSGRDAVKVLDVLIILARHKKTIFAATCIGAVVATALAFMLPNTYRASLALLPPQRSESNASALLSQLGGMEGMVGLKSPNDLYVGILKSRTIAHDLIEKFDLKKVYQTETFESARKRLEVNSTIATSKNGLITVEVDDSDKKRAAALANAYGDELLKLTRTLALTEAAQRRLFFERQLILAKDTLAKTEASLKENLDKNGVVSVDAESRAVVETVAHLKARVSAKEIELNSMRAFVTETNPNFRRVQEELLSLRAELSKLENGRSDSESNRSQTLGTGLTNIQQLRDLKYYQMLYELLAKQYEAARLDEAKQPMVVQVLDQAIVPERPVKPKRAVLVLIGCAAGFGLGIFLSLFHEVRRKIVSRPETRAQWAMLKDELLNKRKPAVK